MMSSNCKQCLVTAIGAWVASATVAFTACVSPQTQRAAVTVADIVNEVSHRGDQAYGLSVEACDTAERAAVALPNLDTARALVERIRVECDRAFQAFEDVRMVIARLDAAVADAESGKMSTEDLVNLALEARRRFELANSRAQWVGQMLETIK
jgi:hypothetical protein